MDDLDTSIAKLQQYSGLSQFSEKIYCLSVDEMLENLNVEGDFSKIKIIIVDIIIQMQVINSHLSRLRVNNSLDAKLLGISYKISRIICDCLNKSIELNSSDNVQSNLVNDLLVMVWYIQTAYDALLAGDIDDLMEHVILEWNARNFPVKYML